MSTSPTTTQLVDEVNYRVRRFGAAGYYIAEEFLNGVYEDSIVDWDYEITPEDVAHVEDLIARYGEQPTVDEEAG